MPTCDQLVTYKCFVYFDDLHTGQCDLDAVGQSPNYNDCCYRCANVARCQGFTHTSSNAMCYLKTCSDGDTRGEGVAMPAVTSGWKKR